MRRKSNTKRKRFFKGRAFMLIASLFAICLLLILPVNIKNIPLLSYYKLTEEDIKSNEDFIKDFIEVKDNIQYLYGNNTVLNNLKDDVEEIGILINKGITEEVKVIISDIKSIFNEISANNQLELESKFNEINDEKLEGFSEDELIIIEDYKNEYEKLYSEKRYNEANNTLTSLKEYINNNEKLVNERRIKEVYEEKSQEDPSLREVKYIREILLVNKEYGLPSDYAPGENVEAREAFENMKLAAANEGIYLNAFSTYRSYYSQDRLYNDYVYTYGQVSTDTFSARAGFSEHQTGLAFDIGGLDRSLWAKSDFQYTEEAKWLKENCNKYGFILRYPEGKEWVTGYKYESWHFRYIGVEHSKNFLNNDLTLEEYLGL